jgi:serine phosphatase RsbU (regulator of sigma subunit)
MKSNSIYQEKEMESTSIERKRQQEHELKESLKYASYIQQAMFPSKALIDRLLLENFMFYQPREAVSGDFYYVSKRNDNIFVAVGDCTGHGVPGALMSILGITCLNEIIMHGSFTTASSILNQMREYIMAALCQTGQETDQKDGIDLALCMIDTRKNLLHFAGAFNPVYIIRNQELFEIVGDMMPVGIGAEEEKSFNNHVHELHHNDMLYLFSDGFADQFGGPSGKKFKYNPLRKLLIDASQLPISEQELKIKQTFHEWKGNQQQIDDVLVFGFRYKASE